MCNMVSPSKPSKTEQDYRAQDDFGTLQRAEEVKGDPQRHQRAMAHGRKQVGAITRVLGRAKIGGKSGRVSKRMAAGRV